MVLIDANLILDLIFARGNYDTVAAFFQKTSVTGEPIFIISSAVADLIYIVREETRDEEQTSRLMSQIFRLVKILAVSEDDIIEAFGKQWVDFQDRVQYTIAGNNRIQYILTSNIGDNKNTEVKVLTPKEYLDMFNQ